MRADIDEMEKKILEFMEKKKVARKEEIIEELGKGVEKHLKKMVVLGYLRKIEVLSSNTYAITMKGTSTLMSLRGG